MLFEALLPSLKVTWHVKIHPWKRRFLLETIILGAMLVSGRVGCSFVETRWINLVLPVVMLGMLGIAIWAASLASFPEAKSLGLSTRRWKSITPGRLTGRW